MYFRYYVIFKNEQKKKHFDNTLKMQVLILKSIPNVLKIAVNATLIF